MTHTPPKNLIVGLDVDGRSDQALRAAAAVADLFSATLRPIHAIEIPPIEDVAGNPAELAEMYAKIEADGAARMADHVREVLGADTPWADRVEVLIGHSARTLLQRASDTGADWIFLGPHEHHKVFDFGSTARAVLAKVHGGVWIQRGAVRPIRRILTPVDLSGDSLVALHAACQLARAMEAKLTVLHCFQDPDFAYIATPGYAGPAPLYSLESAADAAEKSFVSAMDDFDWSGVEHERRFLRGRPVEAVLDCQEGHDLVVMGSHGRTGLAAAVLGNVAYGVLKHAEIPVLALKDGTREAIG